MNDHRRPFDYILFDLGSTLIFFTGNWQEVQEQSRRVLLQALRAAGFSLDEPAFMKDFNERSEVYRSQRDMEHFEWSIDRLLQSVLADHGYPGEPLERLRPILAEMYAVSQRYWQVEADSIPTLEALLAAGYRLGLISNAAYEEDVHQLIDQAGLRPYFDFTLISAGVGYRKPHSKIFQVALDFWKAKPAQTLMVGDTLEADILGAQKLGMAAVWITRRADPAARQDTPDDHITPDAVISALSELPELLERWDQVSKRVRSV